MQSGKSKPFNARVNFVTNVHFYHFFSIRYGKWIEKLSYTENKCQNNKVA